MEVLKIILYLALFAGLIALVIYWFSLALPFLPLIIGFIIAKLIWEAGYDNLAVIVGISIVAGGYYLVFKLPEIMSSFSKSKNKPTTYSGGFRIDNKRATYDPQGNITGYVDKE